MTDLSKSKLRCILRQRRQSLSPEAQGRARQRAAALAVTLPQWAKARHVALYCAADGEIGTADIAERCHGDGIQVYLPVMGAARSLVFARWNPDDELIRNSFGVFEPAPGAPLCPVSKLDIIFLPLVGWDKVGRRLGMGAGYYDRVLAEVSGPLLIGLAHQVQEVDEVPTDPWDISLDAIITDTAIYHRRGE